MRWRARVGGTHTGPTNVSWTQQGRAVQETGLFEMEIMGKPQRRVIMASLSPIVFTSSLFDMAQVKTRRLFSRHADAFTMRVAPASLCVKSGVMAMYETSGGEGPG